VHHRRLPLQHQEHVVPLAVLAHVVGQALLAPLLDLLGAGAFLLRVALDGLRQLVHVRLPEVGAGDEQHLVDAIAHVADPPSGSEAPVGPEGRLMGARSLVDDRPVYPGTPAAARAAPSPGHSRGALKRFMVSAGPYFTRQVTASAARPTTSCTTSTSSGGNSAST